MLCIGVKLGMWIKETGSETRGLILYEVKDHKESMDYKLHWIKPYLAYFSVFVFVFQFLSLFLTKTRDLVSWLLLLLLYHVLALLFQRQYLLFSGKSEKNAPRYFEHLAPAFIKDRLIQ